MTPVTVQSRGWRRMSPSGLCQGRSRAQRRHLTVVRPPQLNSKMRGGSRRSRSPRAGCFGVERLSVTRPLTAKARLHSHAVRRQTHVTGFIHVQHGRERTAHAHALSSTSDCMGKCWLFLHRVCWNVVFVLHVPRRPSDFGKYDYLLLFSRCSS